MIFTDEDIKKFSEEIQGKYVALLSDFEAGRLTAALPEGHVVTFWSLRGLLARLDAAEAYKNAHPCLHRAPHGPTDVLQLGCQYYQLWRKAAGK